MLIFCEQASYMIAVDYAARMQQHTQMFDESTRHRPARPFVITERVRAHAVAGVAIHMANAPCAVSIELR